MIFNEYNGRGEEVLREFLEIYVPAVITKRTVLCDGGGEAGMGTVGKME